MAQTLAKFPIAIIGSMTATDIISAVENGEVNPINVWTKLKSILQMAEQVMKSPAVQTAMMAELDKYGKEGATMNGFRVYTKGGAKKYDFSECNCSRWAELKRKEKECADERKALEKMLISITAPVADVDTGEMMNPAAPIYAPDVIVCETSHA